MGNKIISVTVTKDKIIFVFEDGQAIARDHDGEKIRSLVVWYNAEEILGDLYQPLVIEEEDEYKGL
jgi:hypothetical protein